VCPGFGSHSRTKSHSPAPGGRKAELPEAGNLPTQEKAQHSAHDRQQGEQHTEQQRLQQQQQQQHHQMQRTHSARAVCPGFGSHSGRKSHSPAPGGREVSGGRLETECPATPQQHEQQPGLRQQQQQQQHQMPLRGVPTVSSRQANPFAAQPAAGTRNVHSGSVPADGQPAAAHGYSLSGSVPGSQPAAARGYHSSSSVSYASNAGVSDLGTSRVSGLGNPASLWPPHSASQVPGGDGSKLPSASNWAPASAGLPLASGGGSRGLSGADAAAGCGLDFKGYSDHRGTSTFYDLMANASDIARRPGTEPRRHYEDHSFWRH